MKFINLNNGVEMPMAGIGTFLLSPDEAEASATYALKNGCQLIDTANAYCNEKAVGRAMKNAGTDRKKIFLETKLWPSFYEQDDAVDKTLERLQTDYHVVLPILDGHAGCDKQFTTIENNALDIIEFVNSKLGGSVLMMGGLSLGGQILLEILSQRKDICKYAIVESVLVIPSKFTYSMIKPAFGSCYGLIKYKWFSKLQFKSLRIKSNLFDEYYKDTCAIRKSDMIAFLQENSVYSLKDGIGECEATVQIYVGEKEKQSMKKSAKIIHEKLQDSFIQVLPNMYHGEFSINHADDYVRKLLEIVKRR